MTQVFLSPAYANNGLQGIMLKVCFLVFFKNPDIAVNSKKPKQAAAVFIYHSCIVCSLTVGDVRSVNVVYKSVSSVS